MSSNEIEIVATGEKWEGKDVRATSEVIKELIKSTNNSLILTAFILSDENVFDQLQMALDRGISVDLFINNPNKRISRFIDDIIQLEKEYINLKVYMIKDVVFHSKVLVSDGKQVLIGSANFTKSGLLTNYELGVLIKNPKTAFEIERVIRRFFE